MRFLRRTIVAPQHLTASIEWVVLLFLAFAVLWKGGKSLESTWMLTGIAWLCTYQYWRTRKEQSFHVPVLYWSLAIAFVLWTMASFVHSTTANYGLDEVLRTGSLVFIAFWMSRRVGEELGGVSEKSVTARLVMVLSITTLIVCLVGIAVYILQPVNRLVGTFFDYRFHTDYWPNALGDYLLLAWPLLAMWSASVVEKLQKQVRPSLQLLLQGLILGIPLGCLLLSYSRGSLIAFGGQLVLWGGLLFLSKESIDIKKFIWRFLIVGIIAAITFYGVNTARNVFFEVQSVSEKVTFTADEGTSSVSEREQFWKQSFALAHQKPLWGWGPYSFRFIQPRLQDSVLATSDHPHNVFLKVAMERGMPAAILLILFFGLLLWQVGKEKVREPNLMIQKQDIVIPLLVAVAGVLAHNLIDYNLQFVGIALPLWMMIGLLLSTLDAPEPTHVPRKAVLGVEVFMITVLMVVAVIEGRYLLLSSFGRHAEAAGDLQNAEYWYELSKDQKFSRDMHLSRTLLGLQAENAQAAQTALDTYMELNNEDARAWKLRGDLCWRRRNWDCTLTSYRRAYDLNRFNDLSILRAYVDTLRKAGEKEEIDANRAEFDRILNEFHLAIMQNTHFIALSPNVEELVGLSTEFAQLFPGEEPQYIVMGARVSRHARNERERIQSRPPGYLW